MGHSKSFSQNDGFEFEEACFRKFYKPLSNLPTPPPSSRNSSATQSPRIPVEDAELNVELLAPAAHLTRMLPPGLSIEPASAAVVQSMLGQADLPMDTIALAVCILDALPSRFRNRWRAAYPRSRHTSLSAKRHTLPSGPIQPPPNEAVLPEVVVMCALIIAAKFTEDEQDSTQYFAALWGRDMWSCEQINVTERCIMEALEYRIMPLCNPDYIKEARHDMELCRRELLDEASEASSTADAKEYELYDTMSSGQAVVGLGFQLTPAETPKSELAAPFDTDTTHLEAVPRPLSAEATQ